MVTFEKPENSDVLLEEVDDELFFHFEDSKDGPLSSLREAAFSKMYDDNDVPKTRETHNLIRDAHGCRCHKPDLATFH